MNIIKPFFAKFFSSENNQNAFWLIGDKIFRLGIGLLVTIFVTRYLGPKNFGTLNYIMAITSILGILSSLGMESIVVKDLIEKRHDFKEVLGTAFVMRLTGGILVVILSLLWVVLFDRASEILLIYVFISALSYFFIPFEIIDFYFQSLIKSKIPVQSRFIALFFSTILKILGLYLKLNLVYFISIGTIEVLLSYTIMIIFYHQHTSMSILKWRFNKMFMLEKFKQLIPLALSGMAVIVYMRIDQIMIKHLMNEKSVGVYSAAVRIAEVWYFIPLSIVSSYFPSLLAIKDDAEKLQFKQNKIYSYLLIISISFGLFISFFSVNIISFLYGKDFIKSAQILKINVWTGVFVSIGLASNSFMIIKNIFNIQLYRTLMGVITNIILNFILIPKFGISGAAYATLISYIISAYLSTWIFKSTRQMFYDMTKSLFAIYKVR